MWLFCSLATLLLGNATADTELTKEIKMTKAKSHFAQLSCLVGVKHDVNSNKIINSLYAEKLLNEVAGV